MGKLSQYKLLGVCHHRFHKKASAQRVVCDENSVITLTSR